LSRDPAGRAFFLIYVKCTPTGPCDPARAGGGEIEMLDVMMVVAGVAFFALSVAYVAACDRM